MASVITSDNDQDGYLGRLKRDKINAAIAIEAAKQHAVNEEQEKIEFIKKILAKKIQGISADSAVVVDYEEKNSGVVFGIKVSNISDSDKRGAIAGGISVIFPTKDTQVRTANADKGGGLNIEVSASNIAAIRSAINRNAKGTVEEVQKEISSSVQIR
ncbi:MAG: hypothetical protein R3D71_10890 [Rickettsiales bacterium]